MTDIHLAASPTATRLASVLASQNPHPEVSVYRGVVTPVELDVRSREIEALVSAAAVHDLGWLRRVAVRGEDRFRWLSGMVTNTVNGLAPNAGAWNLVLNAQGRIQGDLTVWRDGEDLELEIEADQHDRLMAHLDRFIIMDDVELADLDGESAIGLTGARAGDVLGRLGLPVLPEPLTQTRAEWDGTRVLIRRGYGVLAEHYTLWVSAEKMGVLWQAVCAAGAQPTGSAALEAFRIAEGIPAYGIDIAERDLAQETSQMRALSFDKGCYLGQEIVERIRSRGNVHRHLRTLELDGSAPEPGTKLAQDTADAGQITSAAELSLASGTRVFAIGMIRAEAEVRKQPLTYTTKAGTGTQEETAGTARVLAAPPTF
ncbi:MAG TPA: folate-binding protein [Terracidiphilus sp.]|jgi:folate-binding protein YgfZ